MWSHAEASSLKMQTTPARGSSPFYGIDSVNKENEQIWREQSGYECIPAPGNVSSEIKCLFTVT